MAQRQPMPVWAQALSAVALLMFAAIESASFLALIQPTQRVDGTLVGVSPSGGRGETDVDFALSNGRQFKWRCGDRNCRAKQPRLMDLRWELPLKASFDVAGNQVVGLTVDGVKVLDPGLERGRQTGSTLFWAALSVAILAIWAYVGYVQKYLNRQAPSHRPRRAKVRSATP